MLALLCVAGLILSHVGVAVDFSPRVAANVESDLNTAILIWMHVTGLWLAILAQALRPAPGREVERYRHHRSAMKSLLGRFEHAGDVQEALFVAAGCEHAASNEMENFLRGGAEARFVM